MKTIGLVGGTGWISTIEYYRIFNEAVNENLGERNFAKCIIYSINQGEVLECHKNNDINGLKKLVGEAAEKLVLAGADTVLLGANTLHQVADDIARMINVPLIHIASATALQIKVKGLKKVGLLGTKQTMSMDFYKDKFKEDGIEVIVPDENDQEFVNDAIHEELLMDKFYDSTAIGFFEVIKNLKALGAEGVILGCTEIPLLIKQEDIDIPIFNTTRIHALAAVEFALQP